MATAAKTARKPAKTARKPAKAAKTARKPATPAKDRAATVGPGPPPKWAMTAARRCATLLEVALDDDHPQLVKAARLIARSARDAVARGSLKPG